MLYLRVLTYHNARYAVISIMVITIIANVWTIIIVFTACIPLQAYWDVTIHGAYCHPRSFFWANTALHMTTDFLIFALPLPIIFKLNVPFRRKVILYCLFLFGFM
jgi:hypothetical protein